MHWTLYKIQKLYKLGKVISNGIFTCVLVAVILAFSALSVADKGQGGEHSMGSFSQLTCML